MNPPHDVTSDIARVESVGNLNKMVYPEPGTASDENKNYTQ